jgi:hypothetical protein
MMEVLARNDECEAAQSVSLGHVLAPIHQEILQSCVVQHLLVDSKGGTTMVTNNWVKPNNADQSNERTEGEIHEFAHRDATSPRRAPDADGGRAASQVTALLQRIAGSSEQEIDRLITELETLRDLLHAEGARVQREITEYAHLSDAVMESTRIIGGRFASWKRSDPRNSRR